MWYKDSVERNIVDDMRDIDVKFEDLKGKAESSILKVSECTFLLTSKTFKLSTIYIALFTLIKFHEFIDTIHYVTIETIKC